MRKVLCFLLVVLMLCSFVVAEDDSTTTDTSGDDNTEGDNDDGSGTGTNGTSEDEAGATDNSTGEDETAGSETGASNEEEATDEEVEETEEEAIDEATGEETDLIVESNFGAQVRLLQLEKTITKSYIVGGEIISILSEKGEDVSELESILDEVGVLREEVSSLDYTSDTAVDDFVNIKRDIIDLNKQFRTVAGPLLSAEDKQALKDALKDNEELASLNQEIRDALHNLNADRVERVLDLIGVSDPELVERVRSGEAKHTEVREELKTAFGSLTPEEKKAAKANVGKIIKTKEELRKKVVEKAKLEHIELRRIRAEKMLNGLPKEKRERAKERIKSRIRTLSSVNNKLNTIRGDVKEKAAKIMGDIKEKRSDYREDFKARGENIKNKAQIRNAPNSAVEVGEEQ